MTSSAIAELEPPSRVACSDLGGVAFVLISGALTLPSNWHTGIMDMHDAPSALGLPVYLSLSSSGVQQSSIVLKLGREIPVELRPSRVAMHVNHHIANRQLALGESGAHQFLVNIRLHLLPAMFMAVGMDEGNLLIRGPYL